MRSGLSRPTVSLREKPIRLLRLQHFCFYSAAKSYSFFTGANHLESGIPKGIPGAIVSGGLILAVKYLCGYGRCMHDVWLLFVVSEREIG